MQRSPAFLPSGIPGIEELIDGAIQHAPHPKRHIILLSLFYIWSSAYHSYCCVFIKALDTIGATAKLFEKKDMINPVAVQYMSKDEIERLMYSFNASKNNKEAQTFEALVRRLLTLLENQPR